MKKQNLMPAQPVELEKLLTVKDVAALLQLSPVLVYRLINYHGLPSIKINGSRRFQPSDLQTWIDQQKDVL